jgi:RNA polymerase sigma-70 factor (ECF subfamily)
VSAVDATSGATFPFPAAARPRGGRRSSAADARDAQLTHDLERARTGDGPAFSRVYRAVQPGLLRYLTVLVGDDAEDVASEAWSQACRDLARFTGDIDGFRAWVATIARHRGIDHHRTRARRPVELLPVDELVEHPAADSTEGAAQESLSTERALAAIRSLPKDQAEAVLLRAVMGLDAKSAGRVLGKRAGAVRTAAYRGLQRLADGLAEEADLPG